MCEPIVAKPISCEDTEDTVALQNELTCGGFSTSLQEYSDSKEQRYEECLENMRTELKSVNSTCDKELEDITEILIEEMKLLDTEMFECYSSEVSGSGQWRIVQEKINKREQRVKTILEEFHLDLTDLEKTRCENIRRVLGQYKEEAAKIGYLSLKDIEKIFEDIIAELNSDTLAHLRHCEDLKLRFRIDGDAIISKHNLAISNRTNELEDDRDDMLGTMMTEQVKELVAETIISLLEVNTKTIEDIEQTIKCLMESLSGLAEVTEITRTKDKNEVFWENRMSTLVLNFESVNTCYINADELLKSAITTLTESFDKETTALVQRLRNMFGDELPLDVSLELTQLENKKDEEFAVIHVWQEFLNRLAKTLDKTRTLSSDIISFWRSNNIMRPNKVRSDLEANFESCHQKCIKKEQELNSKIKTQIKALREAPDKIKLESFSKVLNETFMGLAKMWDENFELNKKAIEESKSNDVPSIVKQTISEANYLLNEKYPKDLWTRENSCTDIGLVQNYSNPLVLQCMDQIDLIENNTYTMYEDLEKYVSVCEFEISEEYDSLFIDISNDVNEKHETILSDLASKNQSIEDITNFRLAELDIHCERLKLHLAGVNIMLNDVAKPYEEIKSDQILKLQEFHDKLTNFHDTQKLETWNHIKSAISQLEKEWDSLSISLENRIFDAKIVCQHKFETLKHSNDSFQGIAKHFKNSGNYSQDELKTLIKELKPLEKIFASQSKTLSDQYNALMNDISRQELDSIITILQDKLSVVLLEDKIEEVLRLTRIKLRSEINQSQIRESTLISKIQCFNSLGGLDKSLLDEIVSLVCSILDDMTYNVQLECEHKPRSSSTPKSLSKKDLGTKRKKSPNVAVVPKSLFENITVEEFRKGTNFLSRVKLTLSEKYLSLIQHIENTLTPKPVETTKSKKKELRNSAESGAITEKIELVRKVLHSYNKECESIWFDQAKEFTRLLTFLRIITKNLTGNILDEAHLKYVDSLASTEGEFKLMTLKILTESTSELNKLRKSIVLPLAHPSYQHKLESLRQQAKSVAELKIAEYKELVYNYKVDLQNKHDDYVEKVTTLKEALENTQVTVFDSISCDKLIDKLNDLESFMVNQPTEIDKDLMMNQATEVEKLGTDEQKESIRTEVEELEIPKYPMSIWGDEEASCPEHASQFTDVEPVKRNSIIAMATLKLKDSVERIQRLYANSEAEANECEKEIAKCMRNFEHDTNQAKRIYKKICN